MDIYIKIFVSLLAVVNPLGAVPIFLGLTGSESGVERRSAARTSAFAAFLIMAASSLVGGYLLDFFGIGIAAFRMGGGILLLLMAVAMLQGNLSKTVHARTEANVRESSAVVPLATPLLAGPGAISTLIIFAQQGHGTRHQLLLLACSLTVSLIIWASLAGAAQLSRLLGRTGIAVGTRLMGLILAAIASDFMAEAARELFPILAGG